MKVTSAEFLVSNTDVSKLPPATKPEFAFIGRSNVGKSSLLNTLAEKKTLAKISTQPGKTQLINHFIINKEWYMVDLPGYGFAKVSREQRARWEAMIMDYLTKRENLMTIFVLVDIRIPPQKSDVDMINLLGAKNLVIAIVFTKTDKLPKARVKIQSKQFFDELLKYWEELPPCFFTSSLTGAGRDELLNYIRSSIAEFRPGKISG